MRRPFRLLRGAGIAAALLVALAPFALLFVNGFRPDEQFLSAEAPLWPDGFTLDHYASVFALGGNTAGFLANSLIVTASTTVLSLTVGCPGGLCAGPHPAAVPAVAGCWRWRSCWCASIRRS